jgi:Fic/DOC family protein
MTAAKSLKEEWSLFVKESEALTGIMPFQPERESTKRHFDICSIVATASCFIDPRFVNGLITGKHREFGSLLRTGTEGALRREVPDASKMQRLLDEWIFDAEQGLTCMWLSFEEQIDEFAWNMHDRLICIHAFKTGNGRTARVVYNHLRCLLGRPVRVIRDEKAGEYYARLEKYREEIFRPSFLQA